MKGFYLFTPQKEYFFVTEQTKRTPKLVAQVENFLNERGCTYRGMHGCFSVKEMMQQGVCEIKHTEKFGDYYDIHGEGWGGCGSFLHENKTEVVRL